MGDFRIQRSRPLLAKRENVGLRDIALISKLLSVKSEANKMLVVAWILEGCPPFRREIDQNCFFKLQLLGHGS